MGLVAASVFAARRSFGAKAWQILAAPIFAPVGSLSILCNHGLNTMRAPIMHKNIFKLSALFAISASSSFAAITDTCLMGTWVPDEGAFASQLSSNPAMGEVEISGDVQMIFTDAGGRYVLDGMVIKVQNQGMPPMEVAMNGSGIFSGTAAAGQFAFTMGAFDYSAKATINMGGSPTVMDIPFSEEMAPMGGGASGAYTCTATSLQFDVEGREGGMVDSWVRR